MHGPAEVAFFVEDDEPAFDGPTVGVVVADRFDAVEAGLTDDEDMMDRSLSVSNSTAELVDCEMDCDTKSGDWFCPRWA